MTKEQSEPQPGADPSRPEEDTGEQEVRAYYKIRFREQGQEHTAGAAIADLAPGELVMVRTEQGGEPAIVMTHWFGVETAWCRRKAPLQILRRATVDEQEKFQLLSRQEKDAFRLCRAKVDYLRLPMHLVRVERFFNGSKIIFYFTAESRVDFRELVKVLVQEFRTRVEMRQIGVRHETQMTGGLGACGRELCCTSFLVKFDSVSIKMAKTQDLPLNPAKISGLCNRLLCCLTYEYDVYRVMKKGMPRVGRTIQFEGRKYLVTRQMPLLGKVAAVSGGEERLFSEEEWQAADPLPKASSRKGQGKKGGGAGRQRSIDIWGMHDHNENE
jgi:cell fate regulator YaaT (PSP1 superfamily)